MVADVITLVFQLSLIGVAAAVIVGLVRDELADRMATVGGPARFPAAEPAPAAVEVIGSNTRSAGRERRRPRASARPGAVRTPGRGLARTVR